MISGSKCRHLNSAGRDFIMEYTAAYQSRSLSFCNTAVLVYRQGIQVPQESQKLQRAVPPGERDLKLWEHTGKSGYYQVTARTSPSSIGIDGSRRSVRPIFYMLC